LPDRRQPGRRPPEARVRRGGVGRAAGRGPPMRSSSRSRSGSRATARPPADAPPA